MADKSVVQKKWLALYERITGEESPLHASPGRQTIYFLEEQYGPRAYHNLDHIGHMLSLFNLECRDLTKSPDLMEWAIWFHDVVNFTRKPFSLYNEAMSAEVACNSDALLPKHAGKVAHLIMSTSHKGVYMDPDAHLICDLDLAVLGSVKEAYDVYEQRVRKEYAWVPEEMWVRERARILRNFLLSDRIYQTDFWYERLEEKARDNLARALEDLLHREPNTDALAG